MAYAQFGLIQASDFNTFAGGNPTTTTNTLNAVWGTGGSGAGYGQTTVANVTVGQTVAASSWATLISNTASAASHQGSSITSITAPVAGGTVTYLSAIPTNLSTIYSNRLNAAAQGSTSANTVTRGTTWSDSVTFTHTVTFANGDAARYFFNAGGQIKMTFAHPGGTAPDNIFSNLAIDCGTVVISGQSSGSRTVVGTSYTGVTKVGGGGNAPSPYLTNSGYFAQTTANAEIFKQTANTAVPAYVGSYISVTTKTNGTQGSNGDAGSVYTIYTIWDEVPPGNTQVIASGTATTLTLVPPSTTNIANSWGTITLAGSQTGS
jgi:hypothetical protein